MDSQIIKFYKVLQDHQFTEEEMQSVVEGIKAILQDESRENAKKKDISDLKEDVREDINGLREEVRKDINAVRADMRGLQLSVTQAIHQSEEKQSDRFRYVYEKMSDHHRSTISWLVGTSVGVGGLVVAAIKLIG